MMVKSYAVTYLATSCWHTGDVWPVVWDFGSVEHPQASVTVVEYEPDCVEYHELFGGLNDERM